MKKSSLLLLPLLLSSCNNNTSIKENEFFIPITYTFVEIDNETNVLKCFDHCTSINYINEKNENVTLDYNIDDLIPGDALLISHYGEGYRLDMYPGIISILGNITNVEVKYAYVYDIKLNKNENGISFHHVDIKKDLDLSFLSKDIDYKFIISKVDGKIVKKKYDEYEDNTYLYLAYNHNFNLAERYAYLYDFNPKEK